MLQHPRDEREWRQIVERKLAALNQGVSSVTGLIEDNVTDHVNDALGRQPAAPIELVPGTSIYQNEMGEWKGRFTLDFPDVTVDSEGQPITIAWYELQGRPAGVRIPPEHQDDPASTILPPRASAKANPPRVRIGNGGSVRPAPASGTAKARYPALRGGDGTTPWVQMATSNTSSLRVDQLEPGSQWVFRARAWGVNTPAPGLWSAEVTVHIVPDSSPPPQLTKPITTVKLGVITVEWDGGTVSGQIPADFAYAELAHGTAAAPTNVIAYFYERGGFTVVSDVPFFEPQFFRIRAVDESGNKGPWSEQSVAFTQPLVDTDVILSTIDAAKTQLINVDADESILSSTILTRHLVVTEDMTVALLAAHQIVAGDIAANAITASELAAGAVTAVKLTASLVLTTTIIAGSLTGDSARLDSTGLRVYAADPVDGVPNEVIRLGVAGSDDFFAIKKASGEMAASISQTGVVAGIGANFTSSIRYRGYELQDLLDNLPRGVVAAAYRDTDSGTNAEVLAPIPFLRVEAPLKAGRLYRVWTSPLKTSMTAGAAALVGIRYNVGALATVTSSSLTEKFTRDDNSGPVLQELFLVATDSTASFLVYMSVTGGSAGFRPSLGSPARICVEDVGPFRNSIANGAHLDGGVSPPPPKNTYVSQYTAYHNMNYKGDNTQYLFDTGRMYQGLSPAGYGNLKSIALFPSMTSDLSGATVNYIRVYFHFDHWYYNSGGTARIGLHGHGGVQSTFSGSGIAATSSGWPKPGARWVELPSSVFAGFKSGAYKGVYLEGDSTFGTYGYSQLPTIEIGYTK